MHRSFSETKFLCYKACVGAGIDVGRAEDIASSAVRIGAYQSEIFDFLPNLIRTTKTQPHILDVSRKVVNFENVSVITDGPFFVDCLQSNLYRQINIQRIDSVLLLVGFCLHLAPELSLSLSLNKKVVARFFEYSLAADGEFLISNKADYVTLEITDKIHDDLAELEPSVSLFINDKIWREIEDLAANTYVQETEQSRLMGAGAGLTDND